MIIHVDAFWSGVLWTVGIGAGLVALWFIAQLLMPIFFFRD